ncbi:MAG: RDD family protein [Candidatus Melainabacteria bacterium]|nr:RDD family protein [Candidatus Melainabacteria bacterium]
MSHSSQYAGFRWRVLAALIDFALVVSISAAASIITYIFLVILCLVFHWDKTVLDDSASLVGAIVGVIVLIFYYAGMESSRWQATPGKRLLGVSVTDMNGNRLSFGRALVRLFLKIISGSLFGMAYLVCLFTPHKQTLHDVVIGTLVWKAGTKHE